MKKNCQKKKNFFNVSKSVAGKIIVITVAMVLLFTT